MIKSNQKAWLKSYIDTNTKLTQKPKKKKLRKTFSS